MVLGYVSALLVPLLLALAWPHFERAAQNVGSLGYGAVTEAIRDPHAVLRSVSLTGHLRARPDPKRPVEAPPADRGGAAEPLPVEEEASKKPLAFGVWWFAPFLSGGGYSSEAVGFATALAGSADLRSEGLLLTQHGDALSHSFFQGLDAGTQAMLQKHMSLASRASAKDAKHAVVVCHSEPGAWNVPRPLYQTSKCPPSTVEASLLYAPPWLRDPVVWRQESARRPRTAWAPEQARELTG